MPWRFDPDQTDVDDVEAGTKISRTQWRPGVAGETPGLSGSRAVVNV
jgi:hypothetical protein